jgi:hypothetical protein
MRRLVSMLPKTVFFSVGFLESDQLGKNLESLAKPDGSVHFSFSPEAWAELRKARNG